jgi:hypothetical protein
LEKSSGVTVEQPGKARHVGVGEWGSAPSSYVAPTDTIIGRCRILCGKGYWAARQSYLSRRCVPGLFAALLLTLLTDKSNFLAPEVISSTVPSVVAISLLYLSQARLVRTYMPLCLILDPRLILQTIRRFSATAIR